MSIFHQRTLELQLVPSLVTRSPRSTITTLSSLPENPLISLRGPQSLIKYKFFTNALSSSDTTISEVFRKMFQVYKNILC